MKGGGVSRSSFKPKSVVLVTTDPQKKSIERSVAPSSHLRSRPNLCVGGSANALPILGGLRRRRRARQQDKSSGQGHSLGSSSATAARSSHNLALGENGSPVTHQKNRAPFSNGHPPTPPSLRLGTLLTYMRTPQAGRQVSIMASPPLSSSTSSSSAASASPPAARHLEEYHRLSLLMNGHINDLGASRGAPALSRTLVEADLVFAEAEGLASWLGLGGLIWSDGSACGGMTPND